MVIFKTCFMKKAIKMQSNQLRNRLDIFMSENILYYIGNKISYEYFMNRNKLIFFTILGELSALGELHFSLKIYSVVIKISCKFIKREYYT